MTMRTKHIPTVGTLALITGFVAMLWWHWGGTGTVRIADDLGELAAAVVAAVSAAVRATRMAGRARASWALIAGGAASWAIGEATWCYYELLAGRPTPFPSLADLGFLVFPALAGAGILVRRPPALRGGAGARVGLDALLVVTSLLSVSWATVLGAVYHGQADNLLDKVVALAYPASDVALLTIVVVVLTHTDRGRSRLAWLGAGLASLAVADSGFAYLVAGGSYHTGDLVDSGWFAGFLVLALAALLDRERAEPDAPDDLVPRTALLLPYLPSVAGIVAAVIGLRTAPQDTVLSGAAIVMVCALTARQVVVLLDNRALMARVTHQALHDALTGLANRALFADRLEHALELHRRDLRPAAVLLIDLDDFKAVNDTLGHPTGDELLVRVSERLHASVRRGDTIARLGGDEFAILIEDGGDPVDVAARILVALDAPVRLDGSPVPVGLSIGITELDGSSPPTTASEMMRQADLAMYAAKRGGKHTARRYSDELSTFDADELDRRAAFAIDVAAGCLDVAYQPIYRIDGTLHGYETLARWSYAGEPVPPAVFLGIAAETGNLARVDELILNTALHDAAGWEPDLTVSVNLGGAALADATFAERLAALLDRNGLTPSRLVVEVLESGLIEQDEAALHTLTRIRALGVLVAVDDFGAGYASLARLQVLHPDVVKIDRSLVHADGDGARLLRGVTQLARQLGASVIAEGIETRDHFAMAAAAGCDAVQGFLLGRPAAEAAAAAHVETLPAPRKLLPAGGTS